MPLTRVLLVDDNVLLRGALSRLIQERGGMEVVGEASDGLEALEKSRELRPHLILMDIRMPHCNGLEATRMIKAEFPDIRIVMLTVSEEDDDLFEAIKSGAQGYLLKNLSPESFFSLLECANRGEAAISPTMATKILNEFVRQSQIKTPLPDLSSELTKREREVLRLVSQGATNKEIASTLFIEVGTVKNHLHNILEKLHLRNRTQAAAYARREGLSKDSDTS